MAGSGTAHLTADALLSVEHLTVQYRVGRRHLHAVSDLSFDIRLGETLGLVGETGCGKSTAGRAILQLPPPRSGSIRFRGEELVGMTNAAMRERRRHLQLVLQDPQSSLNPRRRVSDIVAAPLRLWADDGTDLTAEVDRLLVEVGLDPPAVRDRFPRQLSGGQAQRVSIARALATNPELLICDEAVSALDVSIQAQILNLLAQLQQDRKLTMLFISHDLAVVGHLSQRVAVMYLGKLCEIGDTDRVFDTAAHPYTHALLQSVPVADPTVAFAPPELDSALPSPLDPPSGCRFRTRCPRASERCAVEEPVVRPISDHHYVACHHPHPGPAA